MIVAIVGKMWERLREGTYVASERKEKCRSDEGKETSGAHFEVFGAKKFQRKPDQSVICL